MRIQFFRRQRLAKLLFVSKLFCALAMFVIGSSSKAKAELVRYDFTGTVTNAFDNNFADPNVLLYDTVVAVDDNITGYFFLNTSATPYATIDGDVAGSGAGYAQAVPQGFRFQINGSTLTNEGAYNAGIANDYVPVLGALPFESLAISDGEQDTWVSQQGTQINVDGNLEDGYMSLQFNDNDATAFSSTDLPSTIDLADFEIASGTVRGTRPTGTGGAPFSYSLDFTVETLSVTAIPEPGSLAVLSGLGVIVSTRRRRR